MMVVLGCGFVAASAIAFGAGFFYPPFFTVVNFLGIFLRPVVLFEGPQSAL
jgi:hypothetical protein